MNNQSYSPKRFWSIMTSVLLIIFLMNIDYTAVNMTLVPISTELGINLNLLQWLLSAYVLIWGALVVPCGRLADIHGKKKMFLLGLMFFTLGSLITGLGNSIEWLIAGRIVQGIGGAMMSAPLYSLLFSSAPTHMQGFAMGMCASASGIGLSIGPPISAMIIELFGWRWIFLVNVPLCLIVLAIGLYFIPRDEKNTSKQKLNYLVAFLLTAGLATLIYGLNQIEIWGLQSPALWLLIGGGITALVLFYQLDHRLEPDPKNQTLPKSLLQIKLYKAVIYMAFVTCVTFSLTLFMMALMLQNIYHMTMIETGTFLLWFTIIMGVLSPFTGKICDKIGLKLPVSLGIFLLTLAFVMYLFVDQHFSYGFLALTLVVNGAGINLLFAPLNTLVFRIVPKEDMNTATGLLTGAFLMGHTFSMVFVSSLLVYWGELTLPKKLAQLGLDFTNDQAEQIITILGKAKHTPELFALFPDAQLEVAQQLVRELFMDGFHANVTVALALIAISGLYLYKHLRHAEVDIKDAGETTNIQHL